MANLNRQPGAPVPPILPPQNGFLILDKAQFRASFAANVGEAKAAFMATSINVNLNWAQRESSQGVAVLRALSALTTSLSLTEMRPQK